jgi:hypothetical protein
LGEADKFLGERTAGFCEQARVIATLALFTLTDCCNLDGNLERDKIRWIAGIAMAWAWSVVELRIWMRKGVYRLKFLQNHCL